MAENIQKARMQQKRDLTTNWAMVPNFIPKPGELVIYGDREKDKYLDPTTPARIKIGDGVTPVSDLPGISGELYVQREEPVNAGEGALWIDPDNTKINPGLSAVSDWQAREGEVGFVKNKPLEVIQTYITLINDTEAMEAGERFDVSENYYGGRYFDWDVNNIELVLANDELDYVLIPKYYNSFIELFVEVSSALEQTTVEHAVAFCGAGSLGMSLTTLAILHLFKTTVSGEETLGYEVLAISNDTETAFQGSSLSVGTHFYLGSEQGIYISSLKFFYNSPIISPKYQRYIKDGNAVNVYSIGTTEEWIGILGGRTEESLEIGKQALFSELKKYQQGDILLVPTILLSNLDYLGG